jgi:hypothetical protein
MLRYRYVLLVLALVIVTGCGRANKESVQQAQPVVAQTPAQPVPAQAAPQTASQPVSTQPAPENTRPITSGKAANPAKPAKHIEKAIEPPKADKKIPVGTSTPIEAPPAATIHTPEKTTVAPPEAPQPVVLQAPPVVPKAPEPKYATIPQGTSIWVRLQQPLDSGINKAGDSFRAILDRNIEVDGVVVAPRGSTLDGQISQVERAGRVQGRASMTMKLVQLIVENQSYPLQTVSLSNEAQSTKKKDATKVGIGAGLGALIGGITGGGKGAAIGTAVGAGAGGATVVATRGDELRFESEHKLTFVLQRDVTIRLQ